MFKNIKEKIQNNKDIIFDIFAIILIILFAVSLSPKTLQNDTFYTVKIGKLITENGIDMKDHFSWHEGLPYTYPHWLYDVIMYHIFNIDGWNSIYISTCVFAGILGACIYFTNSKLTKNKILSFFVTIGSLYMLQAYIAARAQLVTFILFILLVYNIEKYCENRKIKNAFALFLIHILIANLHAAVWPFTFVLYLPYIGEYLICEIVEATLYHKIKIFRLKRKIKKIEYKLEKDNSEKLNNIYNINKEQLEKIEQRVQRIKIKREEDLKNPYKLNLEKNTNVRWLIIVMIIALFTGLCTPLGFTPYTYIVHTLQSNETQFINEHLPMTLVENPKILCAIVIFLGILTFTKAKIKLSDLFMIGGLSYLMLASRRQSSMFTLIGTIVLTRILSDMITIYTSEDVKNLVKKYFNKFMGFVIAIIIIIISINNFKDKIKQEYIESDLYPVEASEWILNNLDVNSIKLFNEYNYGSYLLYRGIPVFIDSRADLYAPEFNNVVRDNLEDEIGKDIFSDFINVSNIGTYYGETFKKYEITHVITKNDSKLNMLIKNADSEKYKQLYSDKNFIIYEILEY